jgi:predicted DCC family thiol-disulfide oxidoreductase YuxK
VHILFYDGTCRFCDRFVQLGLRHDRARIWRYSPLQSDFAARELTRYGIDSTALESVRALMNFGTEQERLISSSDAALAFLRSLSGQIHGCNIISLRGSCSIKVLAPLFGLLPRFLREPAYRLTASNRYRLFGRYEVCKVPDAGQADLFIE